MTPSFTFVIFFQRSFSLKHKELNVNIIRLSSSSTQDVKRSGAQTMSTKLHEVSNCMHHQILSKRDGRNLRYSCDGQIFI
jgi:hypothetical protein